MKKKDYYLGLKIVAGLLALYMITHVTLFVLGQITQLYFWVVLIIVGIIAMKLIPALRKRIDQMKD